MKKRHKYILVFLTLFNLLNFSVVAQQKELVVTYKFDRIHLRYTNLHSSEIVKSSYDSQYLKVYDYGNVCLRETWQAVSRKPNSETPSITYDTTYQYTMVDYTKAQLWDAVIHRPDLTVYLKESLNLFSWKIERETKTLLGYNCTKATCTFRGRDYVAYFTREIPFKAGPWKFHGLPGVILEVYTSDDFLKWKVQSIHIRSRQSHPEVPSAADEVINLKQYLKILRKKKQEKEEGHEPAILRFPQFEEGLRLKFKNSKLPNNLELFDLE
jgi:GLPGLI family protein